LGGEDLTLPKTPYVLSSIIHVKLIPVIFNLSVFFYEQNICQNLLGFFWANKNPPQKKSPKVHQDYVKANKNFTIQPALRFPG